MHIKRLASFILLGVATLAAASPWLIYSVALAQLGGHPIPPTNLQSQSVQLRAWQEAKGAGTPQLLVLNPVNYAFVASMAAEQRASSTIAWQVARDYNAKNLGTSSTLRWHIAGAALTIWLTRNWSMEQLLTRAAELHARSAA